MAKNLLKIASLMLIASPVMADDAMLTKQLEKMGATHIQITDSALPNFKTAIADQGVLQISNDGHFIIQGQIFEVKNGKPTDITNRALLAELNAMSKQMVIYPAKNEKHVVTVFMDITCHYCHLMFNRLQEYNDLGITVRFMAFPRKGLDSQTAKQMEAIWTAQDNAEALKKAEGGELPQTVKSPDIVKKQYEMGIKFGVTGTPNIVTSQGELIAGYVEPKALLAMLEE